MPLNISKKGEGTIDFEALIKDFEKMKLNLDYAERHILDLRDRVEKLEAGDRTK